MANLVRRISQSADQIVGDLKDMINPRQNSNENSNNIDTKIDGDNIKQISGPTKSFLVKRSGTYEQQLKQVEIELKHAHMQLMAERGKVRELESTLKGVVDKKYKKDTNIISQLQQSQNKLREQLGLVIQSKMDLCESTANEIERLRRIIQILMNKMYEITGKPAIMPDINKFFMNNYDDDNTSHNINSNNKEMNNNNINNNNSNNININDNSNLNDFPHNNESKIDLRILQNGDGKTFAEPFASVDLKYTGFIYHRSTNEWKKFTNEEISNTIFETKLGNNENIIGLEQAVLSMTKGEIAQVYVPSRLAYGVHGAKPLIPPNSDLIFKLTLVEIHNDNQINDDDQFDNGFDNTYDSENNDDDLNDRNDINNNNNNNNNLYNNTNEYNNDINNNDIDYDDIDDDDVDDDTNNNNNYNFGATSLVEPFQDL